MILKQLSVTPQFPKITLFLQICKCLSVLRLSLLSENTNSSLTHPQRAKSYNSYIVPDVQCFAARLTIVLQLFSECQLKLKKVIHNLSVLSLCLVAYLSVNAVSNEQWRITMDEMFWESVDKQSESTCLHCCRFKCVRLWLSNTFLNFWLSFLVNYIAECYLIYPLMSVLLNRSTPNQALACLFGYSYNWLTVGNTLMLAKRCEVFANLEENHL